MDETDESSDDEVQFSEMLQPPLINQLKKILDEYPDDGQILKVIKVDYNVLTNSSTGGFKFTHELPVANLLSDKHTNH